MKVTSFEELDIWKMSSDVAIDIYKISNNEKFSRDFGLRNQIRRAVVSISSNIAEGFEIHNNNDFIRFLRIAKGSSGETKSQLYIALQLSYLSPKEYTVINEKLLTISLTIGKLIKYLLTKKNNKEFVTR